MNFFRGLEYDAPTPACAMIDVFCNLTERLAEWCVLEGCERSNIEMGIRLEYWCICKQRGAVGVSAICCDCVVVQVGRS